MRKKIFAIVLMLLAFGVSKSYAGLEHMIPQPAEMTVGTGELTLPASFTIAYDASLAATEMVSEINGFVNAIKATTNLSPAVQAGNDGLFTVAADKSLPAEGYKLDITDKGVSIKTATSTGLFYAFQTVKKLLPVNVMAGVAGASDAVYTLPVVAINDAPRFEYRGFMLDVSRHFFDVAQVKKMLDVMAMYKLNRFHWHLTDDQGWRLPVAKYPKLTVEGATNKNILLTNFETQTQTRAGENVIYGPFAYLEEEIRDIVAYAKARHIEVIPEIDMPGHMVAAIHAYPYLSTDPESKKTNIHPDFSHEIWNKGGVSRDVLDVSNPKVMEFVQDVVDVLADLFPYEYIHIGGDECPTLAWENSESCQAKMKELGLSNARALQSWFTKEIATYAREKHGRKIMGWNELITEGNVDMNLIKEIDPTIFCWIGGEAKAQNNGLKHVYTPFNGGYYINRSYAGFDKVGAVGDGALSITINVNPPANSHCIGVQGTFWTEQVDRPTDLEYLALPRLIGIAEQGWSSVVRKDYDEFLDRVIADAELLKAAGYNYGAHQLVKKNYLKPDPDKWYRIKSASTDERSGLVWEVLASGSPIISSKSGNGAKVNRLWGNTLNAENDYQLFRFVEDPNKEGRYAIVCKAIPEGSLSSTPTGTGLTDRWEYKTSGLDYGFILDKGFYNETGNTFRYAITSENLNGLFMNFSRNGQGLAINVYNAPNDGAGGLMVFNVAEGGETPEVGEIPEVGKYYRLHTRFNGDTSQSRYGSVIELLRDEAGKGNNAQANRLWSNAPANDGDENYDYQWFTFEPDPQGSGHYAMVCKAKPGGSVNSTPSVANNSNTARWDYDDTGKHYGFYLVESINGNSTQGIDDEGFYSALTSTGAASGWYMNTSASGQGFSIHLYSNPLDQNAGLYTFELYDEPTAVGSTTLSQSAAPVMYDITGRRISVPVRGVNIVNGKKILFH